MSGNKARRTIRADGTIGYSIPWIALAAKKPFKMAALKPRVDKPEVLLKRVRESIEKSPAMIPEYRGRPSKAPGLQVAVVDRYRALLVPGEGKGDVLPCGDIKGKTHVVFDDPEFHLTVKRALVMAQPNQSFQIRMECVDGIVTMSSSDSDCGDFHETFPVQLDLSGDPDKLDWRVAVNGKYLELVCGMWPLHMWIKDEETELSFGPADGSWRYVLLPMLATWKTEAIHPSNSVPAQVDAQRSEEMRHMYASGQCLNILAVEVDDSGKQS